MALDLVFAKRAGLGEGDIEAELLMNEEFEAFAPDREATFGTCLFIGDDGGEFLEGLGGGFQRQGEGLGFAGKAAKLVLQAVEKFDSPGAGLHAQRGPKGFG